MSNKIAEAHERGANILKLRRMVSAEKALDPLMEEVGKLYGMSGDEITEILSVGASVILYEAGVAPEELTELETAEAVINQKIANEHIAKQEG